MSGTQVVMEGGSPELAASNADAVGVLQAPLALFTAPGALLDWQSDIQIEAG
jgi:hypothetical protein